MSENIVFDGSIMSFYLLFGDDKLLTHTILSSPLFAIDNDA